MFGSVCGRYPAEQAPSEVIEQLSDFLVVSLQQIRNFALFHLSYGEDRHFALCHLLHCVANAARAVAGLPTASKWHPVDAKSGMLIYHHRRSI